MYRVVSFFVETFVEVNRGSFSVLFSLLCFTLLQEKSGD